MAVKVFWQASNGSSRETEHERGNDTVVDGQGHLFVRHTSPDGRVDIVAGYAPGKWVTFMHSNEQGSP